MGLLYIEESCTAVTPAVYVITKAGRVVSCKMLRCVLHIEIVSGLMPPMALAIKPLQSTGSAVTTSRLGRLPYKGVVMVVVR